MAQWKYQFCGHTHASKVRCIEFSLNLAVNSLSSCPEAEQAKKFKAVFALCERLLSARLKQVRAEMIINIPRTVESTARFQPRYDKLAERADTMEKGGIKLILREFGVSDEEGGHAFGLNPSFGGGAAAFEDVSGLGRLLSRLEIKLLGNFPSFLQVSRVRSRNQCF